MNYLICQIGGRQYFVEPGVVFEVDKLPDSESKSFSSEKVLLLVTDGKAEIGKPFLSKKVEFERLDDIKKPKIRVARYSPKSVSNRKVNGSTREMSRLKLAAL